MRQTLPYIILALILYGCSSINEREERTHISYRQRIENSSYVLYEFYYPSEFATTSDFYGITIIDSNETFAKNKIDRLPSSCFTSKPAIGNLKLLEIDYGQIPRTEKDTLLTPKEQFSKKFNGVKFEITKYNDTYGSAAMNTGLMMYGFDSLKETKDSLTLFNVTKISGGKIFPSTTSFLKGNIKVVDSADNKILKLEVKHAIIERGNIYRPGSRLKLVPNQPIVGFASYEFYPSAIIKSTILTDFGIWKRVR